MNKTIKSLFISLRFELKYNEVTVNKSFHRKLQHNITKINIIYRDVLEDLLPKDRSSRAQYSLIIFYKQ